jgi:hypothetical protein
MADGSSGRLIATLATLGLALVACSEPSIGPVVRPVSGLTRANLSSGHPALHSNSVRYRNNGAKPATGRSGSASLMVRALLGRNGMTDVEVTTGELDSPAAAPGNLAKVQTKAFGNAGKLLYNRNYNGLTGGGSATLHYPGLLRGWQVQVQANVRGIDPKRTDVVTVMATTKLRPDLKASGLQAPPQAPVNTPVNVSATVSEANGDVGARANCVLYVNGAEADRSNGIWVDAGDAVSCAFTQSFSSSGTRSFEVRGEGVVPGDDDPSNNSVSGSIDIVSPGNINYYAYANDQTWQQTNSYSSGYVRFDGLEGSDNGNTYDYSPSRQQYGYLQASSSNVVAFPLRVDLSQESGGATLHSVTFDNLPPDNTYTSTDPDWGYTQSYVSRSDNQYYFYLSTTDYVSQPYDQTSMYYQQYVGSVTYFSTNYGSYWNLETGYSSSYSYNSECIECGNGVPFQTWGPDITIRVSVDDGNARYFAEPTIRLESFDYTWDNPEYCYFYDYSPYHYNYCSANKGWAKGVQGYASGP